MFLSDEDITTLKDFLKSHNIDEIEKKVVMFDTYAECLYRWNEKTNLTRVPKEEVVQRHFLDSLSIIEKNILYNNDILLDMGTGAGFPGLALKIAIPSLNITLLDSALKKIDFLNYVIKELDLENIEAIHSRIEDYQKDNQEKFTCVTARALSNIDDLVKYAYPFLKQDGKMIFLKSKNEIKENEGKEYKNLRKQIFDNLIVLYKE